MINRIVKGIAMPLLLSIMLLLWEALTQMNFQYFWGILLFFVLAFILNFLLKNKLGYSFHIGIYFYLFLTIVICWLISPSPFKTYATYQSLSKSEQPIVLQALGQVSQFDLVKLKDAKTLKEGMKIDSYGAGDGGGDNGARGIIPIVNNDYTPGDSIYAYAAFTTYVGDEGNDSWFALDRDESDYEASWGQPVASAKIVQDTGRIQLFNKLMNKVNSESNLVPASKVMFVESNFPSADINYVAHQLTVVGLVLMFLAAAFNINVAVRGDKKVEV